MTLPHGARRGTGISRSGPSANGVVVSVGRIKKRCSFSRVRPIIRLAHRTPLAATASRPALRDDRETPLINGAGYKEYIPRTGGMSRLHSPPLMEPKFGIHVKPQLRARVIDARLVRQDILGQLSAARTRSPPISVASPAFGTNPQPSFRFHLRQQTAAAHAELDATVGQFESLESYRRYCRAMLRFRGPLERAVVSLVSKTDEQWSFIPISDHLRADLNDLGGPAYREPLSSSCQLDAKRLPGALYVLEGSSLGAQLLVKRAALLGLSAHHGARHLAQQTGDPKRWPAFVKTLERHGTEHPEEAVRGALDAFAAALEAFRHDD